MKKHILLLLIIMVCAAVYAQSISGVVNQYSKVLEFNPCDETYKVGNPELFNQGDKVFLIQIRGATVASSQTFATDYGEIENYNQSGLYEFAEIEEINGSWVTFKHRLNNAYDLETTNEFVSLQMIKVFRGVDITTSGTIQSLPWNGATGGVVVIECSGSFTMNHDINVSGHGFRGGIVNRRTDFNWQVNCNQNDKRFYFNHHKGGNKGEGICTDNLWGTNNDVNGAGYGRFGNAGGGGNDHNSGGGGGGHGSDGGQGGYEFSGCATPSANGGQGGAPVNYVNRLFFGGGGGAGHGNDGIPTGGGAGGGIIILICNELVYNGGILKAEGNSALNTGYDGAGGGGAGGTIYLKANSQSGSAPFVQVNVRGGNGGSINLSDLSYGPGGGGSPGILYISPIFMYMLDKYQFGGNAGIDALSNSTHGAGSAFGEIKEYIIPTIPFSAGEKIGLCKDTVVVIDTCALMNITLSIDPFNLGSMYEWHFPSQFGFMSYDRTQTTSAIQGGVYLGVSVRPDGCRCSTTFVLNMNPVAQFNDNGHGARCGDLVNLDELTLSNCNDRGSNIEYYWYNIDNELLTGTNLSQYIHNSNTSFKRVVVDKNTGCILCEVMVNFNITNSTFYTQTQKQRCTGQAAVLPINGDCLSPDPNKFPTSGRIEWYRNGVQIPASTSTIFIASTAMVTYEDGFYSYVIYDSFGCPQCSLIYTYNVNEVSCKKQDTEETSLGLTSVRIASGFTIYPNPISEGKIIIVSDRNSLNPSSLKLVNSLGNKVPFTYEVENSVVTKLYVDLPYGVYILQFEDDKGNRYNERVVINRY